ncbi:guanyl-nucleotide exchange factor [Pseudozyma hubeiensis SY62]|uniref:Guanyl-nucleotide exchange factor n=1 Tax=Pseudozyma hubeiensis (strain SY62) TaxID=1305764 RepID=R9P618_PSEHS|nr:guanyl-nucleotide exchange factor [Pseudozyma hubeiensis SY62]GAC96779.1 guanyl-nucleotide exchange factor [Pseudozyma hubeiensis SY62]
MVSAANSSEGAPRASTSQREPQRGLEALSNFYGRFSTDNGSLRSKVKDTSVSSYADSVRRSSSGAGTEFYSNAHSLNGADEQPSSNPDAAPPTPKSPRVYTSFSAAAAAASRSSLNKRNSQASIPATAAASPSIRNSPAHSSPRGNSSASADATGSNDAGRAASGLMSSPPLNKGASFDIAAINQYSPGSLAKTFPWLSGTSDTTPKRDVVASPALTKPVPAKAKTDSPPVEQYSRGKGFGWNPNKVHTTPKSSSKPRLGPSTSYADLQNRGLGIKSSSELDLPERMRSQRKGAIAPPRLSQDPMAFSIEEELQPRTSFSKGDSAFSRLGRAFRRKSKTGSDMKADFATKPPVVPPLPKTPHAASKHTSPSKPSDPFAAKALKASSGFPDRRPSQISNNDTSLQQHEAAPAGVSATDKGQPESDIVDGDAIARADASESAPERPVAGDEDQTTEAAAGTSPVGQQSTARVPQTDNEDTAHIDTDKLPGESLAISTTSQQPQTPSNRPMSIDSMSSSANRSSLAFLAPAISMGAIASAIEGAEGAPSDALQREQRPSQSQQSPTRDDAAQQVDNDAAAPSSSSATATAANPNRRRLEPKSATRDDHVPGILSDFLSMDAALSAKESKNSKGPAPSQSAKHATSATDASADAPMERSLSGTSEGRRSSVSSSYRAPRATKGVFMAPAAGPTGMAGFVSPFYVAPLMSTDAGVSVRRPSGGRRASATSDDSKSVSSGPRRGSIPFAVSEIATQEEVPSLGDAAPDKDDRPEQLRELSDAEKARKVKSFGNLRASSRERDAEALPRASTSRLPSPSVVLNPAEEQHSHSRPSDVDVSTKGLPGRASEESPTRSRSVAQRLFRRPKTSGAEAGMFGERSTLSPASAEDPLGRRRGSGPGRVSLDESGRSSKPYSASPTETNLDPLAARSSSATPRKSHDRPERRPANGSNTLEPGIGAGLGRRPSEQSIGAVTPSSSRLESQGGAAGLFGSPQTRPRTSSLLPSFGFSRSRTGSSAGIEGSGKSPGTFGSSTRSTSGGFRRDTSESLDPSASNSQLVDPNGASKSPRVSSSSRPSFSRQPSTVTGLSEADAKQLSVKPEKKFSMSAFLPYDDEDAPEYAERIASTAPKAQIAAILASSADVFYGEALHHFMTRFWFNSLPLDIALRKLLMDLHLPKETQQIDRVMEAFAKRYNECNGGLFASDDQPYILSFSLMMLHTDAFNKNAKNKMTKVDYLRNTGASGVPTEILEYLYDNLTFTQFIYIEDEEGGKRRPSEASALSLSATSVPSSLGQQSTAAANNRARIDPYFLITQGRLGELRPDLEDAIPEDSPFSFTGSLSTFDVDRLNSAFLHAPSIEIVTTKTPSEQPGAATPSSLEGEEEVVSLKVTKVGVVNRKDDVSDGGKKAASRKWKTSGLLLTGSQLLLFKDVIWINALQSQILDQVGHSLLCNGIPTEDDADNDVVEGGVVITPRITYFKPDGVISLADAVAVKDHSYAKYDFVFRLVAAKGRQYLVQAQSEDDMNDWIHKINFCASFRKCNIKIRGLDLAPRLGMGSSSLHVDSLEERYGRPNLSRRSFDHTSRRPDANESGRTTPVADESGEFSRDDPLRLSMDPASRPSEGDAPVRPRSSASHRLSPASSAIQKRARARREMMLTKIAETEVQLERATSRLADEIRLARHFAILTPFLKSTRDRIEMSALPLATRIRALRLDVAKAQSRCNILRLDLAAGERVARALLPSTYMSSSAMRAANRMPSATMATPQLMELGQVSESQSQFEELFAPVASGSNGYEAPSVPASLSGTVNKPASHQRNQMNLNAVSEQPADESPVMASARQMGGAEDGETSKSRLMSRKSDEVPEDWELSQVGRSGKNRISLVDLPSPNELEEATGGRFKFGARTAE